MTQNTKLDRNLINFLWTYGRMDGRTHPTSVSLVVHMRANFGVETNQIWFKYLYNHSWDNRRFEIHASVSSALPEHMCKNSAPPMKTVWWPIFGCRFEIKASRNFCQYCLKMPIHAQNTRVWGCF